MHNNFKNHPSHVAIFQNFPPFYCFKISEDVVGLRLEEVLKNKTKNWQSKLRRIIHDAAFLETNCCKQLTLLTYLVIFYFLSLDNSSSYFCCSKYGLLFLALLTASCILFAFLLSLLLPFIVLFVKTLLLASASSFHLGFSLLPALCLSLNVHDLNTYLYYSPLSNCMLISLFINCRASMLGCGKKSLV